MKALLKKHFHFFRGSRADLLVKFHSSIFLGYVYVDFPSFHFISFLFLSPILKTVQINLEKISCYQHLLFNNVERVLKCIQKLGNKIFFK